MEFEDRRGQFLRILPKELRKDVFRRLADFKSIAGIKEWTREQLELERNWQETDQQASRNRTVGVMNHEDDDSESEEPDMDALFALTGESSVDEINAVQQQFRKFAGRQQRGQRPTTRGAPRMAAAGYSDPSPPPRAGRKNVRQTLTQVRAAYAPAAA